MACLLCSRGRDSKKRWVFRRALKTFSKDVELTRRGRWFHHYHHHGVACLVMDVTFPIRACSRLLDSPLDDRRLSVARSDSTVRSQVWPGRPDRRFQSLGRGATLALRARLWSTDGSADGSSNRKCPLETRVRRTKRISDDEATDGRRWRTSQFTVIWSSSARQAAASIDVINVEK